TPPRGRVKAGTGGSAGHFRDENKERPMASSEGGGEARDRQEVQYGDQRVERGHGGETHQTANGGPKLTTQQGVVVSDDQNTLRAGERGPDVLEDFHFR